MNCWHKNGRRNQNDEPAYSLMGGKFSDTLKATVYSDHYSHYNVPTYTMNPSSILEISIIDTDVAELPRNNVEPNNQQSPPQASTSFEHRANNYNDIARNVMNVVIVMIKCFMSCTLFSTRLPNSIYI